MIQLSHGDAQAIIRILEIFTMGVSRADNRHINARRSAKMLTMRLRRKCEESTAK